MRGSLLAVTAVVIAAAFQFLWHSRESTGDGRAPASMYTSTALLTEPLLYNVTCSTSYTPFVAGCHPTHCSRKIMDSFVTEESIDIIMGMAERGMRGSAAAEGGPVIFDVHTGYRLDGSGLENVYQPSKGEAVSFSDEELATYAAVFDRIKRAIMDHFGLENLWFTAPTFITRIVGSPDWSPKTEHDEYWHPHVDKNNTAHYDYSGLLYLSTAEADFQGGDFKFLDEGSEHVVQPRAGRLLIFSSGTENLHRVMPVTGGQRFVLSMWFSCDRRMEFKSFLQGKGGKRQP